MADENAPQEKIYDSLIIGASPGGLQSAIYLGRYNRGVLIIDRGGGRTRHARHIENFLSQKKITGEEIINLGMEQARGFGAESVKGTVIKVGKKEELFQVSTKDESFRARFVVASTGGTEDLPKIENLYKFFGKSFFTCIDCDGYHCRGTKHVLIGKGEKVFRLALAMRQMYTDDVSIILLEGGVPPGYLEETMAKKINMIPGEPLRLLGDEQLTGIELKSGRVVPCETILSALGYKLNDEYLSGLQLKRDEGGKLLTNRHFETSFPGLYAVGPLAGSDQAIVAAGEGALAAMDINGRLFEYYLSL
jgi:thioredoxin reductase (NADPH)